MFKKTNFTIAIILFLSFLFYSYYTGATNSNLMLSLVVLMVYLWITEAIHISITALIPIILFPILGIAKANDVAKEYFNSIILIYLGGFIIALCMEKWNLHRRIALNILSVMGNKPIFVLFGFMIATALISAFISNVATTTMMFPIALALTKNINDEENTTNQFAKAVMLSIAYSASIGGVATLIGTAPNLAFAGIMKQNFPDFIPITFANWLIFGVPISFVMLIITWIVLGKIMFRLPKKFSFSKNSIKEELKKLEKITKEEISVLLILITTSLLWLFRADIELGSFKIIGWSNLFSFPKFIDDSTVVIFMVLLLFIMPSKNGRIADISLFRKVPWEIIILFGGGFALAMGFESSGLSKKIGELFISFNLKNEYLLMILVCILLTFLTELTSNTATTYTLLPILSAIAIGLGVNPIYLMLPATISASFAFMLPVATPPNAIVFSSGYIDIKDMIRTGLLLNFIGVVVVTIILSLFSFPIMGIKP